MVKIFNIIIFLAVIIVPHNLVAQNKKSCIRNIDFKNQEYMLQDELTAGEERLPVKNGRYERASEKPGIPPDMFFVIEQIKYGDLTGDGKEEAIVFAAYGSGSGNYMVSITYVFGCNNGQPKLLASLKQDDIAKANKLMVYFHTGPDLKIRNHILFLTYSTDGSHHNPTYRTTFSYRLNDGKLVSAGKVIKRKNSA